MSSLRSRLIRLAHQQPSLRPHLLTLLKSAGNYGEEVNPYLLGFDRGNRPKLTDKKINAGTSALRAIIATAQTEVSGAVRKALDNSRKFNALFSGDSAERFHDDLIASVISAVHNAER